MNSNDKNVTITPQQMQEMVNRIVQKPTDFLQIESCRQFLAGDRWKNSDKNLRFHDKLDPGVMPDTIAHNRREIDDNLFSSSKRTLRLLGPLSAIEPVYSQAAKMKVLTIGPRTEMELLHLYGLGFNPQNVSAVDLISSSPLIDLGDMHDLPYPDRAFHLVISGWTIAYSRRPERAMQEMIRVCKKPGLIAVGVSYGPAQARQHNEDIQGNNFESAAEIAALMGRSLDQIVLQHDPVDKAVPGAVMLIARIKHEA